MRIGRPIWSAGSSLPEPPFAPGPACDVPTRHRRPHGTGDRKSIQPMAHRLGLGSHGRLPHFISAGLWDGQPLQAELVAQANRLVGGPGADLVIDGPKDA